MNPLVVPKEKSGFPKRNLNPLSWFSVFLLVSCFPFYFDITLMCHFLLFQFLLCVFSFPVFLRSFPHLSSSLLTPSCPGPLVSVFVYSLCYPSCLCQFVPSPSLSVCLPPVLPPCSLPSRVSSCHFLVCFWFLFLLFRHWYVLCWYYLFVSFSFVLLKPVFCHLCVSAFGFSPFLPWRNSYRT